MRGTVQSAVKECRIQIEGVLRATKEEVIFAYEPVWAIGQEESADAEYVVAVTTGLRAICTENNREVRILYRGSAAPGTFGPMKEGVDGLFLGRFAHDVGNFEKIIREIGERDFRLVF